MGSLSRMKKKGLIVAAIIIALIIFALVAEIMFSGTEETYLTGSEFERLKISQYPEFIDLPEVDQTPNVKFGIYFERSLDGIKISETGRKELKDAYGDVSDDEIGKKIDAEEDIKRIIGTANEVGSQDIMYMALRVEEGGQLKDAKIQINGKNFYLATALSQDDELKNNYISDNTKLIEFNNLQGGTYKTVAGYVRSGDYTETSKIKEAIGNNLLNYSKENSATLTGTWVSEDGTEIVINQEISFIVDWYGNTRTQIKDINQTYRDLNTRINVEENTVELEFKINEEEMAKQLLLYKNYVMFEVPMIGHNYPTEIKVNGETPEEYNPRSIDFEISSKEEEAKLYSFSEDSLLYNLEDRVVYWSRTSKIDDEKNVKEQISDENSYTVVLTYPIESYYYFDNEEMRLNVPVVCGYIGYMNGKIEENIVTYQNVRERLLRRVGDGKVLDDFAKKIGSNTLSLISTQSYAAEQVNPGVKPSLPDPILIDESWDSEILTIDYRMPPVENTTSAIEIGTHNYDLDQFEISKGGPLDIYNGSVLNFPTSTYNVKWKVVTDENTSNSKIVLKQNEDDKFVFSDETEVAVNDKGYFVGIGFLETETLLNDNSFIYIYDDETNMVISHYEKVDLRENKAFFYDFKVKKIRIEITDVNPDGELVIYNIKELDNEAIVEEYTKEQFLDIKSIKSSLNMYVDGDLKESKEAIARYVAPYSQATIDVSKNTISSKKTELNEVITITAEGDGPNNRRGWDKSVFYIKLPKEIIDVKVNDILITDSSVKLENYEVDKTEDGIGIKLYTYREEEISKDSAKKRAVSAALTKDSDIADIIQDDIPEPHQAAVASIVGFKVGLPAFYININVDITPNSTIGTTDTTIDLYAVNNKAVEYFEETEDIFDINDNLNLDENVNKSQADLKIIAPGEVIISQVASEYDSKGSIAIAPETAILEKETSKAKVTFTLNNNYEGIAKDIIIIGTLPFTQNKSILGNEDLESEFSAYMSEEGIEIPEELEGKVTVLYSETDEPYENLGNQVWFKKENVSDWKKIRSFGINMQDEELNSQEEYQFSYNVRFLDSLEYEKYSFNAIAAKYKLDTPEGLYETTSEANKLGFKLAKTFDIELTKYHKGTYNKVKNATYKVVTENSSIGQIATTNDEGKIIFKDLVVGQNYIVKEYKEPEEYYRSEYETLIRTSISNTGIPTFDIRGEAAVTQDETGKDLVQIRDYDSPKVKLQITNVEAGTEEPLANAKITLVSKAGEKTYISDENGIINIAGLEYDIDYVIRNVKYDEYYTPANIEFMVNREKGLVANLKENIELIEENEFQIVNVKIEREKKQPFTLNISKIRHTEEGQEETYLEGATFRLYKNGKPIGVYTTDETGHIVIDNLETDDAITLKEKEIDNSLSKTLSNADLDIADSKVGVGFKAYKESVKLDEVKYVLKEIQTPEGYAKTQDISFHVGRRITLLENKLSFNQYQYDGVVNSKYTIDGNTINLTIEDYPLFKLIKKDAETGEVIPGVKFALYRIVDNVEKVATDSKDQIIGTKETINIDNNNGSLVSTLISKKDYYVITTDENGEINIDLPNGEYCLLELSAPEKYDAYGQREYFTIGENNNRKTVIVETGRYSGSRVEEVAKAEKVKDIASDLERLSFDDAKVPELKIITYSTGTFTDSEKTIGDIKIRNTGGTDAYLVRNVDDKPEWAVGIGGSGNETILRTLKIDEGVIVLGTTNSPVIYIGDQECKNPNLDNIYIAKISNEGDVVSINTTSISYNSINNFYKSGDKEYTLVIYTGLVIQEAMATLANDTLAMDTLANDSLNRKVKAIASSATKAMADSQNNDRQETKVSAEYRPSLNTSIVFKEFTVNKDIYSLTMENNRKEFSIIASVLTKGGLINEKDLYRENVKYGDTSEKEIKITPDEGYEIYRITIDNEELSFEADEDGTYTIPKFENVQSNHRIQVEFSKKDNKLTINKVDLDTNEPIPNVRFRIEQIDERTAPTAEDVVGTLVNDGESYRVTDYDNEISDVIGRKYDDGVILGYGDEVTDKYGEKHDSASYYFIKNGDKLESNNAGRINTTANSYIPIDLTGCDGRYLLKLNVTLSTGNSYYYNYGYATIKETTTVPTYSDATGRIFYSSSSLTNSEYTQYLEGGKIYYLHLGYRKGSYSYGGSDKLTVNSIKLYSEDDFDRYHFEEVDGKYISTNAGKSSTTDSSYIPIDLTDKTGNYYINVNAQISSELNGDKGFVAITTNTNAVTYNDANTKLINISGEVEAKDYKQKVTGGSKYYVHMGYYKNGSINSGEDKFTINSVNVYGEKDYVATFIEEDGKYVSNNQGIDSSIATAYIPIDLRDYEGKYIIYLNAQISSETGYSSGYDAGNIYINESSNRDTSYNYSSSMKYRNGSWISSSNYMYGEYTRTLFQTLKGGNIYYMHLMYNKNSKLSSGDDCFTISNIRFELSSDDLVRQSETTNFKGKAEFHPVYGKYRVYEETLMEDYFGLDEPEIIEFREGGQSEFTITNERRAKVTVHYYKANKNADGTYEYTTEDIRDIQLLNDLDRPSKIRLRTDYILRGKRGTEYITNIVKDYDKYELIKDENGEYIIPDNYKGTFTIEDQDVNFYYTEKPLPVYVNHYIEGTRNEVPLANGENAEEVVLKGNEGDTYTTEPLSPEQLEEKYELAETPENAEGTYKVSDTVVNYFYRVKRFNITTGVKPHEETNYLGVKEQVYGGKITGQNVKILEIVRFGENSLYEIVITPDKGYKVATIEINSEEQEFEVDENGVVKLYKTVSNNMTDPVGAPMPSTEAKTEENNFKIERFTDVRKNIDVRVAFSPLTGKVIVHHLEAIENEDGTYEYTENKVAEDEIKEGIIGTWFATKPAGEVEGKYKFVKSSEKTSGEYKSEDQEVTYYYVRITAEVVGKHVDIITKELIDQDVYEGFVGENYLVQVKDFDGFDVVTNEIYYTKYVESNPEILEENDAATIGELLEKLGLDPDENYVPENYEGQFVEDGVEVKYYYIKKASVKVEYRDVATEELIPDSTEYIYGHEGDSYRTEEKEFDGYSIFENMYPLNTEGVMTTSVDEDGNIISEKVITYYYARESAGVVVKHIDVKSGEILKETSIAGEYGDIYETINSVFDGYDLVEDQMPENANGTLGIDLIEVKYYYIKQAKVEVEYVDVNTEEVLDTETINGHEGDDYEVEPKDIEDYDVVEVPENTKGTMSNENQKVTYKCAHKSEGVLEVHVDAISGESIDIVKHEGHEGDDYEVSSKEFEGYDLIESPESTSGKMAIEQIVKIFYYKKKATIIVKYVDQDTKEILADNKIIEGHEGDYYKTESKKISGKDLVEVDGESRGNMLAGETTITYYYADAKPTPTPPTVINNNNTTIINNYPEKTATETTSNNTSKTDSAKTDTTDVKKSTSSSYPKTGDSVPVVVGVVIAIVIVANIVQTIVSKKKKQEKQEDK